MDPIINELKENLDKTIENLKGNFSKLRSGRANPALLEGLKCDYYGEMISISDISSISMPEARQLLVHPYNRDDLKRVASALAAANLGINPQVEADQIRLIFPPLTEEVRKDTAKKAKGLAEEAKVACRNIRRDYMDLIKGDDSMSDDYRDRVEEDINKTVSEYVSKIDELLAERQKEIMTI